MNNRLTILLVVCFWVTQGQAAFAQPKSYRFEQLDSLQKIAQRPVVVFIYTDWCRVCKVAQATTFKSDSIVRKLNDRFYFVAFNAEGQEPITFAGHTFLFKPTGLNTGIHSLAEQLATVDGAVAYPTLCILNSTNEIIFQYNGALNVTELAAVLNRVQ